MCFCRKAVVILIPVIVAYCVYNRDTFDPKSIRGKRVLVTGASSGIGEQVAYQYAELGAKLIIAARRAELLDEVAKKCKELGAEFVQSVPADLGKPADRKKVAAATEQLGGLDILVLNHAMLGYSWWKGTTENLTLLENMMNVNFISYVDITSQLLDTLKANKGYICVVSSLGGKVGSPGSAAYCSTKHAIQGFYSSLRQELRSKNTGVSVTIVPYGPVASENSLKILDNVKTSFDMESFTGSTANAAEVLIKGVARRAYEVYFPVLATILNNLIRICPEFMANYIASQIEE